jgi:antirestriction protein ArdC
MTEVSIFDEIAASIAAEIDPSGKTAAEYKTPWQRGAALGMPLRHNDEEYQGINPLVLWIASLKSGYASPYWMTFKQALEYKGGVRKGQKGTRIIYAKKIEKDELDDDGKNKSFAVYKHYTVFNADQIDGLPAKFYPQPVVVALHERIRHAEEFIDNTRAEIIHGGNAAFYSPGRDIIQMPPLESFFEVEGYYSTLLHEATHWTGAEKRLDRKFKDEKGTQDYAKEELCAELCAAFLCARLHITPEPRPDHAAYIASWLKALKGDKKYIFAAAAKAQAAVNFLEGLQPKPAPELNQVAEPQRGIASLPGNAGSVPALQLA